MPHCELTLTLTLTEEEIIECLLAAQRKKDEKERTCSVLLGPTGHGLMITQHEAHRLDTDASSNSAKRQRDNEVDEEEYDEESDSEYSDDHESDSSDEEESESDFEVTVKHRRKRARLSELALVHKQSVNPPRLRRAFRSGSSPPPIDKFSDIDHQLDSMVGDLFRVFLATKNAFPDEDESEAAVDEVISFACKVLQVDVNPDMIDRFMPRAKETQVKKADRMIIQTLVEGLIAETYGISDDVREERVKCKVEMLLQDSSFCYADPKTLHGQYENIVLPTIIARKWFGDDHSSSLGLGEYSSEFDPIPLPLVAYVLALIEIVIQQWENGHRYARRMHNLYRHNVYVRHLAKLEEFAKQDIEKFEQWRCNLQETIYDITGIGPASTSSD